MKITKLMTYTAAIAVAGFVALPLRAATDEDARIVSTAKESYVYRTYLKDDHIRIQSKDGIVTLKGRVIDPSHKQMAEDIVQNVPGVRSVDDLLRVQNNPATEKSDDAIRFRVKSELLFHRSVSETKTDVAVNNGIVTLTGVASSEAEKELAGQYAKDVDGVRGVNNELTVSTEPPPRTTGEVIDDASVTAQVKADLLFHHSTSAIDTKVITRDGVVTLSGMANSQAEKDLATKLASDIRGVKSVVNNMEVKN